jgi:hypothetical protein
MAINRDRDNYLDGLDNCPAAANNDQQDADSDDVGDACDPLFNDGDSDTVPDAIDNCPLVPNSDQTDTNNDGTGDACTKPPGCE